VSFHEGNGTAKIETHHEPNHYRASQGTTLIVSGGAGCDEMSQGTHQTLAEQDTGYLAPVGSLAVTSNKYSTGVLKVNGTNLFWHLYDSVDGSVIDQLTLTK
jgi:hypothetical protein